MTDLRTAAQAVVNAYYSENRFSAHAIDEFVGAMDGLCKALRQALAEPVKPFAVVRYPKTGGNVGISWVAYPHEDCPYFPKDGDLLYATPPSVDALIAEIYSLELYKDDKDNWVIYHEELAPILDKYRGVK